MSGSVPAVSPAPRSRRWRVPPPAIRPGDLLEGNDVLGEVESEAAMLLWKGLRALTLWTSTLPSERAELFSAEARQRRVAEIVAAEVDRELRTALESLAALLDDSRRGRRELITLACRRVAQWASSRGASRTELAYIEAASLASPADAGLALLAGRLNRALGEGARAEGWYRRAILLGRQTGEWPVYVRGFVYLGSMARRRGNFRLARRFNEKGLRAAKRRHFREGEALALHELFAVSLDCEEANRAQRYAVEAFRAYGARHPNLRFLAHDLSCLWIREGQFARAIPVLQSLTPLFHGEEKLLGTCNLVRAAGGVGNRQLFEISWGEAERLVTFATPNNSLAAGLLSLARGATGVAEWDRAEEAAERALEVATQTGSGDVIFQAEAALDFARSRRAFECNVQRSLEEEETAYEEVNEFAVELSNSLRSLVVV
jgi:hypothetical protein